MLSYWFYLASIYLVIMTWQDYFNNMNIDDRRNYFMLGLTISLISHVSTTLVYKLVLSFIIIGLNIFLKKTSATGEADISTLSWIFLGFGLIHYTFLLVFFAIFCGITLLWFILKRVVFGNNELTQFYGVILLSYLITAWLVNGFFI